MLLWYARTLTNVQVNAGETMTFTHTVAEDEKGRMAQGNFFVVAGGDLAVDFKV